MRRAASILVPLLVVLVTAYPGYYGSLYARREIYRLFELVGIMDPKGPLGGQIMRFNYQRHPAWSHQLAIAASGLVFAPPLLLAIVLSERIAGRSRATRCGGCGRVLAGLVSPACPHCGRSL